MFGKNIAEAIWKNTDVEKLMRERYGIVNIVRSGDELRCSCPLPDGLHSHGDRSPSFGFNLNNRLWGCFVDGGGNAAQFIMRMEGVSYQQAVNILREYQETELDFSMSDFLDDIFETKQEQKVVTMNSLALGYARNQTDYWFTRGYTDATIKKFNLGYDKDSHRATVPHYVNGECVGIQYRTLNGHGPKWQNTPLFPKRETLFNYDNASLRRNDIIVCEAACSAIYLNQNGYNGVATFGASPSQEQAKLLRVFEKVILFFDPDAAGEKAAFQLGSELNKYTKVYIVFADGDPNDLSAEQLYNAINNAVPFFG